jgi:hypothetical protein
VLAAAVAAVAFGASSALAALPSPTDAGAGKLTEAQRRFDRGIDLYKGGDFAAAMLELERAYALVPNYKILYDLGQISFQRDDHAGALRYLRRYLREGGDKIPPARQRDVAGDLAALERRVGRLELETTEPAGEMFVDDVLTGTTPLQALVTCNAGKRKIDLVMAGGDRRTRLVDVAAGEIVSVSFPPRAVQRPDSPPPSAGARALSLSARRPEPAGAALAATTVPVTAATRARKAAFPWKAWTLTALLAGGAATTGAIALRGKHDLDASLNEFPQNASDVDFYRRRTRGFAIATDGLLFSCAALAALSLYFTFRHPG